ncbi:3-oxoacyl-ACP synthase [Streptomyces sp. CA-210063]|uniref:3-oxoacyl-ACP synthase n=1 Tax=Streptomyces sp. CA-210063 TaxID=2801029 RepID=UPI00214A91CF|nr:3-oxoacyl-ACP synthase [Streptomyces sp. CA-210063]UUU34791.1 3-oxoacyl-ACP synthase [Streptomyces sp. CA-210063]
MRLDSPLGLIAAAWYPKRRQTVEEALAVGDIDARTARDLGYTSLPVSEHMAPPDMAVEAATEVLTLSGAQAAHLSLVLHASVHHQGHDAWSAPHYVARRLGAHRAVPIGLLQQCNGGAIGIELAASRLQGDPAAGPALVTTADRFLMPSWHRWLSDYGMAAGDAATAVLVHRVSGAAEASGAPGTGHALAPDLLLHSLATDAAAELEVMHRGDDELNATPMGHSSMIDVRRTKRAFIKAYGVDFFLKTAAGRIRAVVEECLADAGLAPDDPRLRYAVIPRLGSKAMAEAYIPPLTDVTSAEVLDLGRATGHVGAGDLNASLADLSRTDLLEPGQYALVLNGGGGFTFTAVVVGKP